MRSPRWLGIGALAVVAATCVRPARLAHADDDAKSSYRAVIDRVDLEPAAITGDRLRVYLSALTLDGALLDLTDPKFVKLMAGNAELKDPFVVGRYGQTPADTAIVFVIEETADFGDALPTITDQLDHTVFAALNDAHTQVAILAYGDSTGSGKLMSAKSARGKLGNISSDGSVGDPALLDTLDRALLLLKKAKTEPEGRPLRKIIVVIGDGRDRSGDRDRVTRLGKRAAKEGVRIHAIAHSPTDVRRPLLLLGELSRQSLGTFRWVRTPATPDSWGAQLKHLSEEISQQYVLTYFVASPDELVGKKLHVALTGRTEAVSNDIKAPDAATCGGDACDVGYCAGDHCVLPQPPQGRGVFGWVFVIVGVGVGAVLVLGLIGFAMSKRGPNIPKPFPPGVYPPGFVPPGQPVAAGIAPGMALAGGVKPGMPIPVGTMQAPPAGIAPAAVAAPAAAAPAGPRPSARAPVLYFMNGPKTGQTLALKHGFTIGKAPNCDLVIDDGYTSGQHAQIGMDHHGNCVLYDRGSTNGTFVNGVRVTEYALSHGVSMRIGSTELRFLSQ